MLMCRLVLVLPHLTYHVISSCMFGICDAVTISAKSKCTPAGECIYYNFTQQMQLPTILLSLVVVLVQSIWTMLLVVAKRVTSLTAHGGPLSAVTLGVGVLE